MSNTPAPNAVPLLAAALFLAGAAGASAQAGEPAGTAPHVVELAAEDYAFRAPDEIPSGWTTLRFTNEGEETHFVVVQRLPDGRTHEEYEVDVGEPFNQVWYSLRDGEIDRAEALEKLGEVIPAWYWEVRQMGGPGLVAPGRTAQTTVRLDPGSYVLECYVKTAEGEFHAMEGMIRPLTVTAEESSAVEPSADAQITLSNRGIEGPDELPAGTRTVAVHFAEHPEGGFPHDAHLVRLDEGVGVEQVAPWVDWLNVEGLQNPAPFTFLGGTHEMPAGSTAYVTVELEPGRYAWLSEATAAQGMVKEFRVRQ